MLLILGSKKKIDSFIQQRIKEGLDAGLRDEVERLVGADKNLKNIREYMDGRIDKFEGIFQTFRKLMNRDKFIDDVVERILRKQLNRRIWP